jgi:hypothetical protein
MSTGGKQRFPYVQHPLFWIGWISGGMASVFAFGAAMIFAGQWPTTQWLINVGYGAATFPTVVALFLLHRRALRRNREILAAARSRAEEDDHDR